MKKILIISLIIVVAIGIVLFVFFKNIKSSDILLDHIDSAKDSANERVAELIITNVELAYTTALYQNFGNNPTLQQVKSNFSSEAAIWTDDFIIQSNGFNCDVKVENNNLKVICLNKKTNSSMILSN